MRLLLICSCVLFILINSAFAISFSAGDESDFSETYRLLKGIENDELLSTFERKLYKLLKILQLSPDREHNVTLEEFIEVSLTGSDKTKQNKISQPASDYFWNKNLLSEEIGEIIRLKELSETKYFDKYIYWGSNKMIAYQLWLFDSEKQDILTSARNIRSSLHAQVVSLELTRLYSKTELKKLLHHLRSANYDLNETRKTLLVKDRASVDQVIKREKVEGNIKYIQDGSLHLVQAIGALTICIVSHMHICVAIFTVLLPLQFILWMLMVISECF
ncbi:hypothetical protein KAFR_0A01250 [Kazachstania africana CBS 2517]|uniref:Uncharacterized protein n=1 Tax=Kazachstania africana (strain ATCC 22294 / BCRC 22015 / CBS 2517 / CECT 1963 / NBRC 1671 / NRRL Y-8276) TaxID=1071382 RepID=H2AMG4_KAZAF|nr:hypothetical protein KAFR_0A01250 [Kazachstania africana CBS 2517]CCF55564.1 hypothetical protein KAFR_0A01250 [Kazachstania africana CBS 2517]